MRAVVVYESMYGNTHLIADAIRDGLRPAGDVEVVSVHDADDAIARGVDLLVVGGPTHVHGMSRPSTRKGAAQDAEKADRDLTMDPDADGAGIREWLEAAGPLDVDAAAFDTRLDAPPALTGRASKGIAKALRKHGCSVIVDPESFLVTKENRLEPDEEERARAWGASLATASKATAGG